MPSSAQAKPKLKLILKAKLALISVNHFVQLLPSLPFLIAAVTRCQAGVGGFVTFLTRSTIRVLATKMNSIFPNHLYYNQRKYLNSHHSQCIQAVTKMTHKVESGQNTTFILEIGDKGIKMVDKSKPGVRVFQYRD